MSEKPARFEAKKELTAQEKDWLEQEKAREGLFVMREEEVLSPEGCIEKIKEFEELCTSFEQQYPLEELSAIVEITRDEADAHPIRHPARIALGPITMLISQLEKQKDIPDDVFDALFARFQAIFQALGTLNSGRVGHERTPSRRSR